MTAGKKKKGEHACHFYMMVTRKKYSEIGDLAMIENFPDEEPHEKDIIMIVKSHLSSTDLAQAPFVFLPAAALAKLQRFPEYNVPRNSMSDKVRKELVKTINKVERPPWSMTEVTSQDTHFYKLIEQAGQVPEVPETCGHPLEELRDKLSKPEDPSAKNLLKEKPLPQNLLSFCIDCSTCFFFGCLPFASLQSWWQLLQ